VKKIRLIGALCVLATSWSVSTIANAAIIYNVDRTVGSGSVTGFIETDGTIGMLSFINITDWNITLTSPGLPGSPVVIDYSDQIATSIEGTATTATATQLLFDFNATGDNLFLLIGAGNNAWCLETGSCTLNDSGETIAYIEAGNEITVQNVARSGVVVFAEVQTVPVPAAAWLFGSGLLGLVSVARRKKA